MLISKTGGPVVRSRLKELVLKKEIERQERIHQIEIVEATGLKPGTISRWMSPKPFKKINSDVVLKLCQYLGCEMGDLLYIDRSN